jgi:rubrerythrin
MFGKILSRATQYGTDERAGPNGFSVTNQEIWRGPVFTVERRERMVSGNGGLMNQGEIKNIIDFAIEKEKEAVDFYTDLATKVTVKALADELRKIATMEEGHRERLERMDVVLVAQSVPKEVPDLHLAEYVVDKKPTPDMSWPDIVNIAMHREQAAVNLYSDLEKLVTEPLSKQMFQNLAAEERSHKYFFEKIWDQEVLDSN